MKRRKKIDFNISREKISNMPTDPRSLGLITCKEMFYKKKVIRELDG